MTMTSERTYGARGHAGRLPFRCAGSWRCGQVVSQELQHLQLCFICCLATWLQGCRQPPHVPVFYTVCGGHMGSQAEREGKLDLRTHKIGSSWCILHGATCIGNNSSSASRVCQYNWCPTAVVERTAGAVHNCTQDTSTPMDAAVAEDVRHTPLSAFVLYSVAIMPGRGWMLQMH